MKNCPKFTFGVGDRFAHGAHAQLTAFIKAKKLGIDIAPVWNKSNREHNIIGSEPAQTRAAADKIAAQLGDTYLDVLEANREIVSRNVTGNLLERHIKPLFQILRV